MLVAKDMPPWQSASGRGTVVGLVNAARMHETCCKALESAHLCARPTTITTNANTRTRAGWLPASQVCPAVGCRQLAVAPTRALPARAAPLAL